MSLKQTIDADIKKAMLAKEKDELRALRAIKSMILLAETEAGAKEELEEADELKLLSKAVKQRKESAETYKAQGREDLAAVEEGEIEVINRYLPKMLTEAELEAEVDAIIKETGASGMKDMGKVMGIASQKLAGKADGKAISVLVKSKLT
ncbi:GatB/YqeY domain-containing protein [Peijinzhouia sedimentorum]